MATDLVIQNVPIRYPHLAEMWTSNPAKYDPDYNIQIIFPQNFPQWEAVQASVNEAIAGKWGTNVPQNLKMPWLNKFLQPNLQTDGPYQGCYFMNAAGKGTKPGVVGPDAVTIPDLQIKQLIFSGCICHVFVNFSGYDQGPGIGCYLQGVQLVSNNVERIADAGRDVTQVFKAIPGAPAPLMPAPQQQPAPVPGVAPTTPPWG